MEVTIDGDGLGILLWVTIEDVVIRAKSYLITVNSKKLCLLLIDIFIRV